MVGTIMTAKYGSVGGWRILLLAVIILAVIVMSVIKKVQEHKRRREELTEMAYQEKLAEEKRKTDEIEQKRAAVEQQKKLIEKYRNSPLLKDVLNVICCGAFGKKIPEKIVITNNWIQGIIKGEVFTYDFAENRVHALHGAYCVTSDWEKLEYIIKPQMAMAEALNTLFDNSFEIKDEPNLQFVDHEDSDGNPYTVIIYNSDHVTMVLKSTLPNKYF